VYTEDDIILQCPRCSFYNIKLLEDDFERVMVIYDLDPIFVHKQNLGRFYHYAWPPLTKEEFNLFRKRSPKRAEAILKKLRGEALSDEEDSNLRNMKSVLKQKQGDLRERINYIKIKLQLFDLLDRI
jgi:hypothetical protein